MSPTDLHVNATYNAETFDACALTNADTQFPLYRAYTRHVMTMMLTTS